MKILLVEDDANTAATVKNCLTADSHTVELATDGGEGSFLGRSFTYDAILLDYVLPKKDGLQVLSEIRKAGINSPILFLSTTEDVPVKVAALNGGADDYVIKPFSLDELRARIRALSRRPKTIEQDIYTIDDLSLDTKSQTVTRAEQIIHLTRKEFNLLEFMFRHKGIVQSRAAIMDHVWTADTDILSNTVESHIRNLRRKLNIRKKPNLIGNIPGRGYVMDTPSRLKILGAK